MSAILLTPTQIDILRVLGSYLGHILPDGYDIVQGQISRVPMTRKSNFAVMWFLRQTRLSTNMNSFVDGVFTGTIAGSVLTVTAVDPDYQQKLLAGSQIFGVGMEAGTKIISQSSGTPGGIGVYKVNKAQSFSGMIAAGTTKMEQATETVIQIDVHGPDSSDMATIISTAFRDEMAASFFEEMNADISPLYADDPIQMAFQNAEQQWEDRWIVEAHIEVNYSLLFPQQFFTNVLAGLINVDTTYPLEA